MAGSRKAFDRKLDALAALRLGDAASAEPPLRKALADYGSGLYSAKAAGLAEHFGLRALVPELLAAFDHFFRNPVKSDPQCWAKNAIVRALHSLGHRGSSPYLRGLRHIQMEPVWGGAADTAGTLRGRSALALIDVTDLSARGILTALTDMLVDSEGAVRLDAVRAIALTAQPESALLIRFKALTGDPFPDVMRECLQSLMTLAPLDSFALVARFLDPENELLCADAAEALAASRHLEPLEALLGFLRERPMPISTRRSALLTLSASPLPEAAAYLAAVAAEEPVEAAEAAIKALAASRFRHEYRDRAAAMMESRGQDRAVLRAAWSAAFIE